MPGGGHTRHLVAEAAAGKIEIESKHLLIMWYGDRSDIVPDNRKPKQDKKLTLHVGGVAVVEPLSSCNSSLEAHRPAEFGAAPELKMVNTVKKRSMVKFSLAGREKMSKPERAALRSACKDAAKQVCHDIGQGVVGGNAQLVVCGKGRPQLHCGARRSRRFAVIALSCRCCGRAHAH